MEERTIRVSEGGWSATLTKYRSVECGETVAAWVTGPDGSNAHAGSTGFPFTEEGAREALEAYKGLSEFLAGIEASPMRDHKPSW